MGERREPKTADRVCAELASRQAGIITRAQAEDAGVPVSTIEHRVRFKIWPRIFHGAYRVHAVEPPWLSEVAAAAISVGGAAIGPCAAKVWGFDGFERGGEIQVVTGNGRRLQGQGNRASVSRWRWLTPEMVTRRDGVPVLQPLWTLLSLGDFCTRDELEGAVDYCLRRCFTTWEELEQKATKGPIPAKHRGVALLRELLDLRPQRQHTHSYLETRMLQLIRNHGLPDPVLQHRIHVGGSRYVHADFAFLKQRVLVETVGMKGHCSEVWQYTNDCKRNNAVSLLNEFVVLHYTWKQVVKHPESVVAELASALGIPVQEGLRLIERRGGPPLLALPL